jgi:hypothetical protein
MSIDATATTICKMQPWENGFPPRIQTESLASLFDALPRDGIAN